jgi:hypothetical protein
MKTRTEITIETERWIVVTRPRKKDCSSCGLSAEMMSELLAALTDPNSLDVYELADAKLREFASIAGSFHTAKRQSRI